MKSLRITRLRQLFSLTVAAITFAATCFAADPPKLDAVRAAKIATDYLSHLGSNAPHIVSISLQRSAIVHGETSWVVRWSRSIAADGDQEVGLRVNMNGSAVRLVKEKGSRTGSRN